MRNISSGASMGGSSIGILSGSTVLFCFEWAVLVFQSCVFG